MKLTIFINWYSTHRAIKKIKVLVTFDVFDASYIKIIPKPAIKPKDMKISKLILSFAAILLAMTVSVISCKKKDTTANDSDTSSTSDNSLAEKTSDDVTNMAGQASEDGTMSSYRPGSGGQEDVFGLGCAIVTRDIVARKITVTFNGTCLDGSTRSGTLTFDYSGSPVGVRFYRNPGFKCVVTSNGYTVDGNAVSINKTITNTTDPKIVNNYPATVNE